MYTVNPGYSWFLYPCSFTSCLQFTEWRCYTSWTASWWHSCSNFSWTTNGRVVNGVESVLARRKPWTVMFVIVTKWQQYYCGCEVNLFFVGTLARGLPGYIHGEMNVLPVSCSPLATRGGFWILVPRIGRRLSGEGVSIWGQVTWSSIYDSH